MPEVSPPSGVDGDSVYVGMGWDVPTSPFPQTAGATWHLGQGCGAAAKVITITVSTEATGSQCILQGTAEVITAS